uniref:TonB-dependent receptor n=1 Tax=Phenylobacterium glaciei TaxID=2803784 RepID=A0A974SAZ7_9CAUL|nr:TonB-dependent receptor [Phenylobacterium glaciei]
MPRLSRSPIKKSSRPWWRPTSPPTCSNCRPALGFAMGGEYRKEESRFVQDALGASGALFINPIGTRAGEYDTREGYAELRVPILKDVFLAKELTVEVAGRVADYSTIGKTDQYRVAAEWAPIQDIRFRASQGTAVRAPNIVELFSPQSRNFTSTAIDPATRTPTPSPRPPRSRPGT